MATRSRSTAPRSRRASARTRTPPSSTTSTATARPSRRVSATTTRPTPGRSCSEGKTGAEDPEQAPADGKVPFFRKDQRAEHQRPARRHGDGVGPVAPAFREKPEGEPAEGRTERHAADLESEPQDLVEEAEAVG